MSEEPLILSRTEGEVLVVTLNRERKRNALTAEMVAQLADAVCTADEQPGIRAVIVEARGPIFCAGIDLPALAAARASAGDQNPGRWLRRFAETLQYHLNRIESTELPVIGALNGKVIGLGLELALCFDLRVAAEDVCLSLPETRLGLVADVGGTTRLTRLVGPSRTKDIFMTAREVDAAEALQWGLVNRVAPGGQAFTTALELARRIAENAPLAVGMAKRIIDQGQSADPAVHMALERWAQGQLITTEDMTEAITAFLEKRAPVFKGR